MTDRIVGNTVIIHRDDWAYISHPSIAVLDNGDWLVACNHSRRRDPRMHPPEDPLFRTLVTRSADQGRTWSLPAFAPDFDWSGTECPGIAQLSDGTVVLTQFRFGWYPLAVAKKRRADGEPISICLPGQGWTEQFSEDDWSRSRYTWARGYHGLYAHLSQDRANCFDHTTNIDTGEYRNGYTRTGVIELADGRVAYAVTEHHPPTSRYTYLLISKTRGRTWEPPILIVDSPQRLFSEPDLAEVAPGELLCMLRSDRGYLYQCSSRDGGQTWTNPQPTTMAGLPGHLLVLSDGRILCSYGRRRQPFGIRTCLSEDGGRTWPADSEIVVRDDLPNADLGYPTTIEFEPGCIFVCYYGQEADGITCVQGTYVTLR